MFSLKVTPRVTDTDGAGHVNNNASPVWFEAGRREIFRMFTPDLSFARWRLALVNMNVDYLAQLHYHHDAEVRTWVDRIGTKSFTLYEEIWQRDTLCTRGTATYVCFNYQTQASEPIPGEVRARLGEHLREG
jgi:acyl-CoA thioester hydrolase